ncbi:MAG: tetratricopeptide repeat protein, partial [bacterium]|nr:tetratricopeptide repeat protein [bacterium]
MIAMIHASRSPRTLLSAVAAMLIVTTSLAADSVEEKLWHHRNLGKAFYENPATRRQAVGEFKAALELAPDSARERINYGLALLRAGGTDAGIAELEKAQKQAPTIPHTWFNLGIGFQQAGRYPEALAQFQGMIRLVPDEPISFYNLGVLCRLEGRPEEALEHFLHAAELDPDLAAPHYQLASAYRRAGRLDEAKLEMATFKQIKDRNARGAVEEDLEWSIYAEIYETIAPRRVPDAGTELALEPRTLASGLDPSTAGLIVVDADGDRQPDLLAFSTRGVRLLQGGSQAVTSGLEELAALAVAPGDFDNDGLADLCVVTKTGAALYVNRGAKFEKHPAALPAGSFRQAVWLDFDHDYDVDLFLLGARSVLMRNNGAAGFSDQTADFPFVAGRATAGTTFDLVADTQGMDLVVAYADRCGVLYRDGLAGRYRPQPLPDLPAGAAAVAAGDVDKDGWTDLVVADASGVVLLVNDQRRGFASQAGPSGAASPLVFADLHNRAIDDLVAGG